MKFLKGFLSLMLMFMVFFGFNFSTTSAAAIQNKNDITLNKLESLESSEKYNFELISFEDLDKTQQSNLIKFDSIEEFEEFLKEVNNNQTIDQPISVNPDHKIINRKMINSSNFTPLSTANSNHTITWWSPFAGWGMTGAACWKNVSFNYEYTYPANRTPKFVSVSNITSYYSGIQIGVTWNQTSSSYSITKTTTTNDTAKITVDGYSLLGFEVSGFAIGAKINNTWEASLQLLP